jgi:hypothetical protein
MEMIELSVEGRMKSLLTRVTAKPARLPRLTYHGIDSGIRL